MALPHSLKDMDQWTGSVSKTYLGAISKEFIDLGDASVDWDSKAWNQNNVQGETTSKMTGIFGPSKVNFKPN